MSRVRTGLVALMAMGVSGFAFVIGCTATGEVDPVFTEEPTDPPGSQLPPVTDQDGATPEPTDASTKKDATTKDGSVDAGPPPPVAGTPCTVADEVRVKQCGACGKQATVCLGATDAGAGTWSEYGVCENEVAGGCIPGTVVDEACGNCGTRKKTCTAYCAFTAGACTGQPASSCVPGNVDLSNAGCTVADTYRTRTCGTTCVYNSFTTTCTPAPTTVEVGPTIGSVTSTIVNVPSSPLLSRASGTCPNATLSTTISTAGTFVQVHNPLATPAVVAVYNSLAPGGAVFKTMLVAYDGATPPSGDAARKACIKLATTGTSALTGDVKFASLDGTTRQLTLAPNQTVTIYVAAYNAYDATKPADSTGKVKLNVSTVQIN